MTDLPGLKQLLSGQFPSFLPTPPNQATPVGSLYSCPLSGGGAWPTATSTGWGKVMSFVHDTHVCRPPPSGFQSWGGAGNKNNDVAVATLLALGPNYRILNAAAMDAYGRLSGTKIAASTLAALCKDTNTKEEPLVLSEGINQCQHKQLSGLGQGSGVPPSIWQSLQQQVPPFSSTIHQNHAPSSSVGDGRSESGSEELD